MTYQPPTVAVHEHDTVVCIGGTRYRAQTKWIVLLVDDVHVTLSRKWSYPIGRPLVVPWAVFEKDFRVLAVPKRGART